MARTATPNHWPMLQIHNPITCDLCDVHKTESAAIANGFRVLSPVFMAFGGHRRFAGRVQTATAPDDNSRVKELVQSAGEGRVLVVDGGVSSSAHVRRALLGGELARAAAQNGWAGVVVQGGVRDAAELAATPLGIAALALCPMPTDRKGLGDVGVAVQVGGQKVKPGDWLYADEDGIVVADRSLPSVAQRT